MPPINNNDDFTKMIESYARFILDGMDYKTLEVFAYDTLVDNLTKDYESVEELTEELREKYDEETLQDLMTPVKSLITGQPSTPD